MTEVEKPGPVDTSAKDAGIAAQIAATEATKTKEPDAPKVDEPEVEVDEQNDSEDTAATETEDTAVHKPKNRGVGKRIDELTREKYEAIRKAEALEARLKALEQQAPKQETVQQDDNAPKLEDFDFDVAAYTRAMTKYELKAYQEAEKSRSAQEQQQKERQERIAKLDPADWQKAMMAPINYTEAMQAAIWSSDDGLKVAVYLADHLDEAHAISTMSPYAAAAAMGRIEAKLGEPQKVPAAKPVTKAPPPVTTLSGAAPIAVDLSDDGMSVAEYAARRRQERIAKGLKP